MICKNCNKPVLKSAPYCSECGAKNEAFKSGDDRLAALEAEVEQLKSRKATGPDPAGPGDESLLS